MITNRTLLLRRAEQLQVTVTDAEVALTDMRKCFSTSVMMAETRQFLNDAQRQLKSAIAELTK